MVDRELRVRRLCRQHTKAELAHLLAKLEDDLTEERSVVAQADEAFRITRKTEQKLRASNELERRKTRRAKEALHNVLHTMAEVLALTDSEVSGGGE